MTQTALIRFARAFDSYDVAADRETPRQVFDRDAFVKHPRSDTVVVDHDNNRVVAHVRDLGVVDDVVAGTVMRWHVARVEGDLPGWVRSGTPASFGYKVIRRMAYGAVDCIRQAILDEITIVSSAMKPVDPLAAVMFVRSLDPPPKTRASAAGRDAHPAPVADDVEVRLWQSAAPPGTIRRHAIGTVLRVR
jgi:hypothetical protein